MTDDTDDTERVYADTAVVHRIVTNAEADVAYAITSLEENRPLEALRALNQTKDNLEDIRTSIEEHDNDE